MPKDMLDIGLHFAVSIVIVALLAFSLSMVIGETAASIVAFVANQIFWYVREADQYRDRYVPHSWGASLNFLNWSRQKKLEGLAAPAAGGAIGVLVGLVVMEMT